MVELLTRAVASGPRAFLAAGLLLLLPTAGLAQSTGSILGSVSGPAGEPLRGAQVSVVSPALSAVTAADGRFVVGAVPAGERVVRVQMLGYRTLTLDRVQVRLGRATELRVRLEAAPVEMQPLEVNAERIRLIEPDVSTTHAVIAGRELRELPLDRLDQALALATGV
ncbi:MAG TPA: carboxypeptidase-like regulatory domain-containing protein, partial [Longimicrobiales bacterium]